MIEKITESADDQKLPICLEGKRACPPEDCGSVPGYYNILKALKNPQDEESKDILDWIGGYFDPEEFDIESVNSALSPKMKSNAGKKVELKVIKGGKG